MNLQQASKYIITNITAIYNEREAQNICNILLEDITQLSITERLINKSLQLSDNNIIKINNSVDKLLLHQPIQQIIGYTWFANHKFMLDENVLIPRPETDELVAYIIAENKGKKINILDIGTGSGCIAISLKKALPNAIITAIDISTKALNIAKQNAKNIGVEILFTELNFLNENSWNTLPKFDIIVSNPPYIKEIEQQEMSKNVLLHEPHLALFVPNNNALIFYEKIKTFAKKHLNKNGIIWLEINETLAPETAAIFELQGFLTKIIKDMQGKNRMIKAS